MEVGEVAGVEAREGECVLCFVARAVAEHGCDGSLRWAASYAAARVPDAVSLLPRLAAAGGGCDCTTLGEGYRLQRPLWERDLHTDELRPPARPPPCAEVRRTSARPCVLWVRPHQWDRQAREW